MNAVFLLWTGPRLRAIVVLHNIGGVDLNATAQALLKDYQFGCPGFDPDSCTIYLADAGRLTLVGDEVIK